MSALRPWSRRLTLGLPTVLGVQRRGFFIPYRYADRLPPPGARPPYRAAGRLLRAREAAFAEVLAGLADFEAEFRAMAREPAPAPTWLQDWFPRLDAAVAYAFVRWLRPRRIVEVGSGHSTRFLARAIADARLPSSLCAIDPAPRVPLDGLGATLVAQTVQEAGEAAFAGLAAGDVVFVDSSHVLMPGSDVDLLLGRILPELEAGVLVHLHDIFLPDDYPAAWAWRGYNEQPAVAAMLAGGGWEVLFASHYAVTRMASAVAASAAGALPLPGNAPESSLWLRRVAP